MRLQANNLSDSAENIRSWFHIPFIFDVSIDRKTSGMLQWQKGKKWVDKSISANVYSHYLINMPRERNGRSFREEKKRKEAETAFITKTTEAYISNYITLVISIIIDYSEWMHNVREN